MTSGMASAARVPDATSRMTSGYNALWTGSTGSTDITPPEVLRWDIAYKNEMPGNESINAMSNYKFGSGGQVWGHTYAYDIPSGSTWWLHDHSSELFSTTAQNTDWDLYRNHYYWNDYRCSETWPYAQEELI
ncbi:hypothetical protein [Methanocella conradii]|uniref:hypothetical protein n=1 Tax=Methanocella conradii TaxID=1175444 RepID=UPI0011811319|nr:hypothetical protein [Methanocella conradii]